MRKSRPDPERPTLLATLTETLVRCRGVLALPDHIPGLRHRLDALGRAVTELNAQLTEAIRRQPTPAPASVVYVLPADGAPMMAHSIAVRERVTLSWPLQIRLAPRSWIVVAGPALVTSVRIGIEMQSSVSADFSGHVCQTTTEGLPGVILTVTLKPDHLRSSERFENDLSRLGGGGRPSSSDPAELDV